MRHSGSDAELIELCARLIALERQRLGPPRPQTLAEEHARAASDAALCEEAAGLVPRIAELRATTLEGHRARARARARAMLAGGLVDARGEPFISVVMEDDERLLIALLRDLAAN